MRITQPIPGIGPSPQAGSATGGSAGVLDAIGRTPLVELDRFPAGEGSIWAKLEFCNPGGSSKARAAARMVADALDAGVLRSGDAVIESSSGNMGVGLAQACARNDLRLICVVDPRANPLTIQTMRALGAEIHEVTDEDIPKGGDLLAARLAAVKGLLQEVPGARWLDQYSNRSNSEAHRLGTMREIHEALGDLDYLFVAAGTGGTLKGCLEYLAEESTGTKVVAVDAVGSVLFGGPRGERKLPGMGAGRPSALADGTSPWAVEYVSELECVAACRRLASQEAILAGASSGGVIAAIGRYLNEFTPSTRCACILADSGTAYLDTVYSDEWVARELRPDSADLPPGLCPGGIE